MQDAEKRLASLVAVKPDWEDAAFRLGFLQLQRGDYASAVDSFNAVWDHCVRECVDELGAFPVAGDLVEALVESGVSDRARERSRTWEITPDILGVLNPQGFFEASNPAWKTTLGWSVETIRTTKFFDFIVVARD